MAQQSSPQSRHASSATVRPRPLSADFLSSYPSLPNDISENPRNSSMLYSMLPTAVRSRLPRIPSLRRSVSMYGIGSKGKGKSRSAPGTPPRTRPGTPEEEYGAMILSERVDDIGLYEVSDSDFSKTRKVEIMEEKSGIGWKFAGQGLTLLSLSVNEASPVGATDNETSASFARQLYIHSITYLLRGLPTNLSPEETLSVRSALPPVLAQPIHITASSCDSQTINTKSAQHPPSFLHRALASTIIQMFVLVGLLLPYLKVVLRKMHEYERQHHVTESILRTGVGAVDELGKRGVGVSAAVWGAGVGDLMGWFLEEVGGGVRDGVEGGLTKVRAGSQVSPEPAIGKR